MTSWIVKKGNFFKTKRETIHFIVGMFASFCIITAIGFVSIEPIDPHTTITLHQNSEGDPSPYQKIDAWLQCTSQDHELQESFPMTCVPMDGSISAKQPIIYVNETEWIKCINSENPTIIYEDNKCIFSNDVVYYKVDEYD